MWDCKISLGSFGTVVHIVKFCKLISLGVWYSISAIKGDEYPRVLSYNVWSLGSVGAHGARISSKQCWVSSSLRGVASC